MGGIGVVVGKSIGLTRDRFRDLGSSVADVHAVETGEAIDVLAPGGILDTNAFARLDDRRIAELAGGKVLELREGMKNACLVERGDLGRIHGHQGTSSAD